MSTVSVDATRCEAIGFCVRVAPTVFKLGDAPPVRVLTADVGDDERELVEEAEELCPAQAILLSD